MKNRHARDGHLLTILAVVGHLQLDDGVSAEGPFRRDRVTQARDGVKESGYARADLVGPDQRLAVAEDESANTDSSVSTSIESVIAKRSREWGRVVAVMGSFSRILLCGSQ